MQQKQLCVFLLCVMWLSLVCGRQFHDHLTDDELMSIFKVPRNKVPNYEVVTVAHNLHKQKENGRMHLSAFGQSYDLNLQCNPLLMGENTPIYLAYNNGYGNVKYTQVAHDISMKTYFDKKNGAAVTTTVDPNGNMDLHGILDNDCVLRPLNSTILNRVNQNQPNNPFGGWSMNQNYDDSENNDFLNQLFSDDMYKTSHHIMYKSIAKPTKFDLVKGIETNPIHARQRREAVDIVYPEILVSVDYETLKLHNNDYREVVKYMSVFWNGVDLRFRHVQYPNIRLNIAGIIIPMEKGAAPYLERNYMGNGFVGSNTVLDSMSTYFRNNDFFRTKNFDIAFTVTSLDMVDNMGDKNTAGIAFFAGACNHVSYKDCSVGFSEDNGAFLGIRLSAHELGHLFGASHDGSPSTLSYVPGAQNCPFREGYIMSYLVNDKKCYYFSSCSLRSFQAYLSHPRSKCLRNKPTVEKPYSAILPGKLTTADEQCQATFPGSKAYMEQNMCIKLSCSIGNIMSGMSIATLTQGAVDGTPCGPNKICYAGTCVTDEKKETV